MLCWYADNSELNAGLGADIPDLLIFGGLAVDESVGVTLRNSLTKMKADYSEDFVFPIKWNLKDLRKHFRRCDQTNLYEELLAKSKELREQIFTILEDSEITIILSCLVAYSRERRILKKTREELGRYVFANGLMRFGLLVEEHAPKGAEIVLDWPDKSNPSPFDTEYSSAYHRGQTAHKSVPYISGPLKTLGFSDSPFYASMTENSLLQVGDLIVGAFRDFLDVCLCKRGESLGARLLRKVIPKFYGFPNSIVGRGISVSPAQSDVRQIIEKGVDDFLL